jgi:L-ascorbate metabolism protein UlaG (beta-lactamase superfamily)
MDRFPSGCCNATAMKNVFLLLLSLGFTACSTYNPLRDDPSLRAPIGAASTGDPGVRITFFGNTTLLIDDGTTYLLVDGYFSRPGPLKTLFTKIGPDHATIAAELGRGGITRVDAVLVGHSHYDHALDATAVADHFHATVAGSRAFEQIYRNAHAPGGATGLEVIPRQGRTLTFGEFRVHFARSRHVGAHSYLQRIIKNDITAPLSMPAHYTEFGCGDVFALHISHQRHGNVLVTTTAGTEEGQLGGRRARIVFLGVGLLTKESPQNQNRYWRETVERRHPAVIVPVHWDNFSRKLADGLAPSSAENSQELMALVKGKAGNRAVRILDWKESIWIRHGRVFFPGLAP